MGEVLLKTEKLNVHFSTPGGDVHAVKDLDFEVSAGETLGVVGESGSGKTVAMLGLMGLLADNGRASGLALFDGDDLLSMNAEKLRVIRGAGISMVFQDPMTALNPYLTIGKQMQMVLAQHRGLTGRDARDRCRELLEAVRITDAAERLDNYPHELSGGMRQRVMIATALLCEPRLLIADEPTTALDVTVQAQILVLLDELREKFDTATLLITHDLGVVAGSCDRVLVMQNGEARDRGDIYKVFAAPEHDYTRRLLAAVPRLDSVSTRSSPPPAEPLLDVEDLSVSFRLPPQRWPGKSRRLRAVDGVSLELAPGETLGVVGESGCGKSTLARAILRLVEADGGSVSLLGREFLSLEKETLRDARRDLQVVFQDPLASLDPRLTVRDIVAEPLETFFADKPRDEITAQVEKIIRRVGLEPEHLRRYPHEFSGGQCQRIGIARALITEPKLVICDEPVSALDVSVQAQIVQLLTELQDELGIALVFIAHDLAVVRQISHRVLVMYLGRAVEVAGANRLVEHPVHPYTRALLASVPLPDPERERARAHRPLEGDVPSPVDPPSGCAFRTRCEFAAEACAATRPPLEAFEQSLVACLRAAELPPTRA
jgi:oligopeptide/dipeptide ABC transporter ATP-binding protein